MISDPHPSIIKAFGRRPYRNGAVGRESSSTEVVWLEKTDHIEKRLRQKWRRGLGRMFSQEDGLH
jgi:hypothetical protein